MKDFYSIYPNLKRTMLEKEITQARLGRELGISRQAISLKLHGTDAFSSHQKRTVAKLLRKGIRYLYDTTTGDK